MRASTARLIDNLIHDKPAREIAFNATLVLLAELVKDGAFELNDINAILCNLLEANKSTNTKDT